MPSWVTLGRRWTLPNFPSGIDDEPWVEIFCLYRVTPGPHGKSHMSTWSQGSASSLSFPLCQHQQTLLATSPGSRQSHRAPPTRLGSQAGPKSCVCVRERETRNFLPFSTHGDRGFRRAGKGSMLSFADHPGHSGAGQDHKGRHRRRHGHAKISAKTQTGRRSSKWTATTTKKKCKNKTDTPSRRTSTSSSTRPHQPPSSARNCCSTPCPP